MGVPQSLEPLCMARNHGWTIRRSRLVLPMALLRTVHLPRRQDQQGEAEEVKKVTLPQQAVVFGSDLTATKWAKKNNIPRENVVLATRPDEVEDMVGPVIIVRVSEEAWQPTTLPDDKRVKETEKLLKAHKKKGEEVQEVEIDDAYASVSEEPGAGV